MNINKKEHLSALLDGEAGAFETRRLMDEVGKDEDMATTLKNYALISDLMRQAPSAPVVSNDFLAKLNDQLDTLDTAADDTSAMQGSVSETIVTYQGEAKATTPAYRKPILGLALAAGIAAITVVSVQMIDNRTTEITPQVASKETTSEVITVASQPTPQTLVANDDLSAENLTEAVAVTETEQWQYDPAVQAQIRHYIQEHSKYSSITGIIPTVRAASYKTGY